MPTCFCRTLKTISFLFIYSLCSLTSLTLPKLTTSQNLGSGGWSPLDTDRYPWLQVDLGSKKQVLAIATQGCYSSSDWTTKYRLLYSDTQKNWRPYLQDGNIWVRKSVGPITDYSCQGLGRLKPDSCNILSLDLWHDVITETVTFAPRSHTVT